MSYAMKEQVFFTCPLNVHVCTKHRQWKKVVIVKEDETSKNKTNKQRWRQNLTVTKKRLWISLVRQFPPPLYFSLFVKELLMEDWSLAGFLTAGEGHTTNHSRVSECLSFELFMVE